MTPLVRAVDALRVGLDVDATDAATQMRYEAWAQRETWRLGDEAAPLLVGLTPADWPGHIAGSERAAWAEALMVALSHGLGVSREDEVAPLRVRAWAQQHGIRLPLALGRVLDFIASVLPQASEGAAAESEAEVLRAQERETLLGAALMLVTKEQAACLDEAGCYSPEKIARLIRARALLWFPLAPPALDEAAIAQLIARWIAPPTL